MIDLRLSFVLYILHHLGCRQPGKGVPHGEHQFAVHIAAGLGLGAMILSREYFSPLAALPTIHR